MNTATTQTAVLEARNVSVRFGAVKALTDVSLAVRPGEVLCLLGDNGAGKSTLIKTLSGVHRPTEGGLYMDGEPVQFQGPADARRLGVATVHQYGGTVPLLGVARNFFLGAEPTKWVGPLRRLDMARMEKVALEEIRRLGITRIRSGKQAVGSLSGGERQALLIARATYFGARVLILDEPTSALGVKQTNIVLKLIAQARDQGIAVIFITHNSQHALAIGDQFTVLIHGSVAATFGRNEKSPDEVVALMAGGQELEALELARSSELRPSN